MHNNPLLKKKKAAIITNNLNCERHIQYYSTIEKYFKSNGWDIAENFDVDLVIVCGCGFHDMMYEKILPVFEQLRKDFFLEKNILVMGCLAKTHELELEKSFKGKIINIHHEKMLDETIGAAIPFHEITPNNIFRPHKDCKINNEDQFFHIKVAQGCLRGCTFCVIKQAKGYLQSVPAEAIVAQFKNAISYGYRKIFLMGEDTFAYGIDLGTNIIQLLERLIAIESDVEIHFGSLHIRWLKEYAADLLALCKQGIIKQLHIGLQHVNDEMLKKMGRPMKFSEIYAIIWQLKKECPELYLGADIIVGFPGESKEIFQELVTFVKQDKCFDNIQHNGYSDVKGAPSFKFKNKNSPRVITERWAYLNDCILGEKTAFNRNDDARNTDITFRLTYETDYTFCKDTFIDDFGIVVNCKGLKEASLDILLEDKGDFGFQE